MRILLVEDEGELRELLAKRLKTEGYTVDAAIDGREGLFLGREYAIDLGIVDIGLPKLSGIDLIRTLRKEEKNFPILILTARGNWQDKVEGLEAGADSPELRSELILLLLAGRRLFWGGTTLAHLSRHPWQPYAPAPTHRDETAAILFTTGSTGPAKGAVYTHGNFDAQIQQIQDHFAIGDDEIDLPTFPLFAMGLDQGLDIEQL